MPDEKPPNDPLDLEAVDRAIRINELEAELTDMGMRSTYTGEESTPEMHETFLRNMKQFESGEFITGFERLERAGVHMPDPSTLDDRALHAKLWEIINALAAMEIELNHTDHLSDRQLYEHLWSDTFRDEDPYFPPGSGWMQAYDLIGSGSDEDIDICLRYYDSEEQRQRWAESFPNDVIPPHEALPFDRDRHLPRVTPRFAENESDSDTDAGIGDDHE